MFHLKGSVPVGLFAIMLLLVVFMCGGCVSEGDLSGTDNTFDETGVDNALALIAWDLEHGLISQIRAIELRGYYFAAPSHLPERYRFDKLSIVKSATLYIRDIDLHWSELSPEAQDVFSSALARPSMDNYFDTPDGRFRIHYNTVGTDAVYQPDVDNNGDGVPDYVNAVGESAQLVWVEETTSGGQFGLNYDPPANDGTAGGGYNLYDVYLKKYSGAYGVTFSEGTAGSQYPGRNSRITYIYLDPAYTNFGYQDRTKPMKVTMAHEFFHAIQFIYNANSDTWFWESGATWMEDIIYDDINDYYSYLRARFRQPYKPLKDTNLMYGTCIWNHFLEQHYNNRTIIKQFWEEIIVTSNVYNAMNNVLVRSYNTDLNAAFRTYTQWNYICGKNDDGNHYSEGAAWTSRLTNGEVLVAQDFYEYPVSQSQPANPPEPTAANYFRFYVDSGMPGFKITFNGVATVVWTASIIVAHMDNTYSEIPMDLDANFGGVFEYSNLANVKYFVLITQNQQRGGAGAGAFSYTAAYLSSLAAPTGLKAQSATYSSYAGATQYVYLNWNQNTEPLLSGYQLYRTTQSGVNYQKVHSGVLHTNAYIDRNLTAGVTYYYIVKAIDVNGQESPASNEAHS